MKARAPEDLSLHYPESYPPNFLVRVAFPDDRDAECWRWVGDYTRHGYGKGQGKLTAHRWSWNLHYGPVPSTLQVVHTCENRDCVNPRHLTTKPFK